MSKVSILFIIVQFLDVLTTEIGLSLGYSELNPIANALGMWYIYLLKVLVCIFAVIVIERQDRKDKYYWILYSIPILLIIPPVWNAYLILLFFI